MRLITKRIRNTTTQTCAAHAAVPATPEKPKIAAMMAMTRNVSAQPIMMNLLLVNGESRFSKRGAVCFAMRIRPRRGPVRDACAHNVVWKRSARSRLRALKASRAYWHNACTPIAVLPARPWNVESEAVTTKGCDKQRTSHEFDAKSAKRYLVLFGRGLHLVSRNVGGESVNIDFDCLRRRCGDWCLNRPHTCRLDATRARDVVCDGKARSPGLRRVAKFASGINWPPFAGVSA